MKAKTFPSLFLAAILQLVPICKDICVQVLPSAPFAILWRWVAGAIAYGGYEAIAGASVTVTSPTTAAATNGVPFNYRITVSTYYTGMVFTDAPLPSGLAVNTSTGFITGTPTVSGNFSSTITVSEPGEPTITSPLNYTIAPSDPDITTQPKDFTVDNGANVTFTVTPSGTAPFNYQWRFNGTSIVGATTSSRTVTNSQPINAGKYSVVVSNAKGSVTSSSAILSIKAGVLFEDTFETGTLGNWTTAVSPATALTITTANHTAGGTKGAHVSNILNKMYHNFSPQLEGRLRTTFWIYNTSNNGYGEVRSYSGGVYNSGTLLQLFAIGSYNTTFSGGTGTLAGETLDATKFQGRVTAGSNTGWFNLNAAGCPGRSAGWHKFRIDRSADGSTITFYVDDVLGRTITAATYAKMSCATIGYTGTGTSTAADSSFDDVLVEYMDGPGISVQPASKTVTAGQNTSLSVTATNNAQTYAWRRNGTPISGATASVLSLTTVDSADAGTYSVVVGNDVGSITSGNALLSVNIPPSISSQPQSQTVAAGSNIVFSVIASGTPLPSYQWRFNGTNLSQATTSSLSVTNAQSNDAGTYLVIVSNAGGSVTSANATLTVNTPPTISQQPLSQTIQSGLSPNFSIIAAGTAPLSYQWRFNGSDLPGETASYLTITNAQDANNGSYTVVITNIAGTITSSAAILNVAASQPLQLSNAISAGSAIQFSLSGDPNTMLTIESSSNLVNWNLITNLVNTNGSIQFSAPIQSDPSLFFRAHSP